MPNREIKKKNKGAINPLYGKKGMAWLRDHNKAMDYVSYKEFYS